MSRPSTLGHRLVCGLLAGAIAFGGVPTRDAVPQEILPIGQTHASL